MGSSCPSCTYQHGVLDVLLTGKIDRDSIAWVLNLRGSDVPYNPVFFSYLVITLDEVIFFVDSNKELVNGVARYLEDLGVSKRDYSSLWTYLRKGDIKGQVSHHCGITSVVRSS